MAAAATFLGPLEIILSTICYINLCLIHHIAAQPYFYNCTNPISNYNNNTILLINLNSTLSSVATGVNTFGFYNGVNTFGFYNGTAGQGVDQVNAIALCRGDVNSASCRGCVNDAAQYLIMTLCPYTHKEGFIWFEECMFRYSTNKTILGIMSLNPSYLLANKKNASNVDLYSQELRLFTAYLVNQTFNGSFRKFAARKSSDANVNVTNNVETIYGFMQCTPDITPGDCMSCLNSSADSLLKRYSSRVGARFLSPSCSFRYETYSFLNELPNQPPVLPPSPSLAPPPPPPTSGKSKTVVIVCIIVVLLVLTLSLCIFIARRRRQTANTEQQLNEEVVVVLDAIGGSETRQYDFALIRAATEDFSTVNMLGRGGFGVVYKGVLSNGKDIAVKRLSATSGQGEKEFRNEVMLLAKLQHNCLVKLLGFCLEQTERLLVYEFMANGSLDKILFDQVNRSRLDWDRRYKIIKSVAKGILYLHEDSRLMIIHRDLKASNILLDEEMNAKISDFGMARLFVWDESEANTRRIAGTFGYMAPEYAMHGLFSVKSDVYSYGVLILEIVSGKRNYYSQTESRVEDLLSYAYKIWNEGRASDLIDPMLMAHSYSLGSMIRCIHIALLCVQENVGSRPTMATVVLMLQSLTLTLPLPSEPGFFSNTAPHRPWLPEFQESASSSSQSRPPRLVHAAAHNDPSLNEDTDSYLYPR